MDNRDNYDKLKRILIDILGLEDNMHDEEINQDNLSEWDSAMHLNIIMEIESAFKVSFKIDQVVEMRSLEDVWYYLKQKLQ